MVFDLFAKQIRMVASVAWVVFLSGAPFTDMDALYKDLITYPWWD